MRKALRMAVIYWGDIAYYLSLPLFVLFAYQAMKPLPKPTPESFEVPIDLPFDYRLALFLFFFYLAFAIISLLRMALFKNTVLRHWSYLAIGIFSMICFIKYAFPSEPADIFIARMDQNYFRSALQLMQNTVSTLLGARVFLLN